MKTPVTTALLLQAAGLAAVLATSPSAELLPEALDVNSTTSVTARDGREKDEWHARGTAVCGIYANANYHKIADFAYDFDNKNFDTEWTVGGGKCDRVKCWDTSAVYVCNDNKDEITLKGKQIGIAMWWIRKKCCVAGPRWKDEHFVVSGQQFTPWGWNVNIGFGNCNDPPQIRPNNAGGQGVNKGKCLYQQQENVSW